MTAHKKGGGPSWRNYPKPAPKAAPAPRASWWTVQQSWEEFSRDAAIEAERMRQAKAGGYFGLSIDRFALWD